MKVGLVVSQFGINATKENLIRFCKLQKEKGLTHFGYMIECYMLSILNRDTVGLPIKEPHLFAGRPAVQLRLSPAKNNQLVGINWASEYEFAATLGRHVLGP